MKEPSLDFIVSISKFKKSFLKKKSYKFNYENKLKLLDDLIFTRVSIVNNKYTTRLNNPNVDNAAKNQILHRVSRLLHFSDSIPDEIEIPKHLIKDKDDIYLYFINFRRNNRKVNKLSEKNELEFKLAKRILDSFYKLEKEDDKNYMYVKQKVKFNNLEI